MADREPPDHDPKETVSLAPGTPCVICGKPSVPQYNPFCSRRCADVDLHRWLAGVYRIPGRPEDDEDGDAATSPRRAEE